MIINDRYLNKRPTYPIPEGVQVSGYYVGENDRWGVGFEEDISISSKPPYKVSPAKHPTNIQVLVSSTDKGLLKYLELFNYKEYKSKDIVGRTPDILTNDVRKIISDYYANIK